MASGLLMLLDDIASILDDVSILTQAAAKKTAGVLGDDLALNAQQVIGIKPDRELPVVWAVAKGSLINKLILVPSALVLSAAAPWTIEPLMIIGGAYLCFEGCEKLAHKFLYGAEDSEHRKEHEKAVADTAHDIVATEKSKISGAIRTDFILSAEIVVITLGTVATSPFMTRLVVLSAIGLLMTVGVYGLVAGIVKLDDLGMRMIKTPSDSHFSSLRVRAGRWLLVSAPYLMKFLSIAGTAAMFLVGGGILAHGVSTVHHVIEQAHHWLLEVLPLGNMSAALGVMLMHAALGIVVGTAVLLVVETVKKLLGAKPKHD
jgi:predicted DNA repair protein MutK